MPDCVERLRDRGLLIQQPEREDIAQEILRLRTIIDNVRLAIGANASKDYLDFINLQRKR